MTAATTSTTSTALADFTTLRLGGPARTLVTVTSTDELVAAVHDADDRNEPVLVLGGGSNLVVADGGFAGTVIRVATRGVTVSEESVGAGVELSVVAGEDWDALVARTVSDGHAGLEALSGIPGLTGATPVQNVGAYGTDVAQTISRVRTWDRRERRIRTFLPAECEFGYRRSVFKRHPDRWVVLEVTFQLPLADLSAPVRYAELARALGVEPGARVPAADLRAAVLDLRAGKGMVLAQEDHDTWSAGSFFTNPVVEASAVPGGAPAYRQPDGRVKTSAAWLIEHAGFRRGYGTSRVALSTKHTLALTNRGGATTKELLDLAREVRDGVQRAYGIGLEPEPVLLGCHL